MISANSHANVAISPFLEVFRLYRNAILLDVDKNNNLKNLQNAPFSDYYFDDKAVDNLNKILSFDKDLNISKNFWKLHKKNIKKRISIENKDLAKDKDIEKIYSNKMSKIFNNCFKLIVNKRNLKNKKIVGILDSWIIELFKPLSKLFKDSKFIIVVKDPRATMLSNYNVKKKNWIANPMSFVRNWRKMIDIICYYKSLSSFKKRLYVLKFEKIAENPEKECKKLCSFLNIPYQKIMLKTELYKDYSTNKLWTGNSSFSKKAMGFSVQRNNRWKKIIKKSQLDAVNFIAYHQMIITGYLSEKKSIEKDIKKNLIFFVEEYEKKRNWRTDSGMIEKDLGIEIFKNIFMRRNDKKFRMNKSTIKRLFLSQNSYNYFIKNKKIFN